MSFAFKSYLLKKTYSAKESFEIFLSLTIYFLDVGPNSRFVGAIF